MNGERFEAHVRSANGADANRPQCGAISALVVTSVEQAWVRVLGEPRRLAYVDT